MSQQELADAMGYRTRSTIAKIESGANDVSQKKLKRFAVVLNTTVEALIVGTQMQINPVEKEMYPFEKHRKNVVIILAGGEVGIKPKNIPGQFINIYGKPILVYCMDAYQAHPSIDDIYVVCPKGWEDIVRAYSNQYGITKLRGLVLGGKTGIESLKNGLDYIRPLYDPNDIVIIQEATRPNVRPETISKLLRACFETGSATICRSMDNYVQFVITDQKAQYVNRNAIVSLESPEAHKLSLLNEVIEKAEEQHRLLTESCCTMLLYNMGYKINFIESNIKNIKITSEEDVAAFRAIVQG